MMEILNLADGMRLCEGCLALQLHIRLFLHDSEDIYPQPKSIRFSPAICSLCSLVRQRLIELGPEINLSEHDQKAFQPRISIKALKRKGNAEHNEGVGCLSACVESKSRITIAKFWPCVNPVPRVRRLSDTNDVQNFSFPSARIIEPFVDIRLFRHWVQLCSSQHGNACALPSWIVDPNGLPETFRLIDVKAGCIIDATNHHPYYALSYVWGPSNNDLYTTTSNIHDLKKPNSLIQRVLPQTIVDAMQLTDQLGGKYLWVDRLCVLQDDDTDKSLQIPKMDVVYSLAELTIIAASGSSSYDGLAGLSTPRTTTQDTCLVSTNVALMSMPTENEFPHCAYSQRGWVQQERLLSRRALMFTDKQTFWSCSCADWTERIALEPSRSNPETDHWEIDRVFLGNYEKREFYRGFSRQHYSTLPAFYATKKFSNESDALDAISGLLRRTSQVTGDDFYWGHILGGYFDQSLCWRKTNMNLERRTALCPIRAAESIYSMSFPSWCWLGWKAAIKFVLHIQLITVPGAQLIPEIVFYHLDINDRAKLLVPPVETTEHNPVDLSQISNNSYSRNWKGKSGVNTTFFAPNAPFRDSGRLLFWTSHAELYLRPERRIRLGCVRLQIMSPAGVAVGHIEELTSAYNHGEAWPFIQYKEGILHSFIVISRKYTKESRGDVSVLYAQVVLKVMWIKWEDLERKTATRISVGEASEEAWVNCQRDWRLVTLQ
jgi:Heterokaryon incompatibility protein (HET)